MGPALSMCIEPSIQATGKDDRTTVPLDKVSIHEFKLQKPTDTPVQRKSIKTTYKEV